jgi:hypothetical protein
MSQYELLSLIAAAFALIISVVSLLLSRSTQKKQLKIQETQAAFAKFQHRLLAADVSKRKHAELRAELVGSRSDQRFVFSNAGPGIARNVNFAFANAGGWSSPVINAQFNEIFPIKEFRPSQQHSCIAALHFGHPSVFTGVYSWEDEDGESHQTTCKIPM